MRTRTPDEHRVFWPAKGKSLEVDLAPCRRVVETDVGEDCLSRSFDCQFEVVPVDLDLT
jgi:hypothetical protein